MDVDVLQVERTCQGKKKLDEPEGEAGDIHMYHRICGQPRASMSPKVNLKNEEAFGQHTCGPKLMVDILRQLYLEGLAKHKEEMQDTQVETKCLSDVPHGWASPDMCSFSRGSHRLWQCRSCAGPMLSEFRATVSGAQSSAAGRRCKEWRCHGFQYMLRDALAPCARWLGRSFLLLESCFCVAVDVGSKMKFQPYTSASFHQRRRLSRNVKI